MNAVVNDTGDTGTDASADARIVDALLAKGRLKEADLVRARRLQEETGGSLLTLLARLGLVSERDHAETVAEVLDLPLVSVKDVPELPPEGVVLSTKFMKQFHVCAIAESETAVDVLMADPQDPYILDAVRLAVQREVRPRVALRSEIDDLIERWHGQGRSAMGAIVETAEGEGSDLDDVEHLRDLASEAPVIRLVNLVMQRAVELRASDIHIEPFERRLRIRTRVDGVLKEEDPAAIELAPAILSRLKIMSGLNIAERRLPQDGAVKLAVRGKEVDLRIATAPVAHGECAAIRILDKASVALDFDALGFDAAAQAKLDAVLQRPNGIFLVTGPTGSGKTTTLYAALQRLNTAQRKILSVEDPVEYKIAGVNQIQVKPEIGLTFAHVLRSVLRHDPDVILVGEIRDPETARIAVHASLTGHLVLSTVHTNSAAAAITRLLDMNIEDYLLTSTIAGILSQRLVRVLCPACKTPVDTGVEWLREMNALGLPAVGRRVYRAKGCASCHGTGYRGRTVIAELLVPEERLRRMVAERAGAAQIHAAAVAQGMETLRRNGLRKALEGITSIEEVSRVAQEEE